MMIRNRKRLWALLLSAALIVTQLPAVAMAENNTPEDGSIASFEPLDSGVAAQTVPVGTELSGLNLPDMVTATVYHVTEDTITGEDNTENESGEPSTASPSNAGESISGNNAGDSSNQDSGKTVTTVTTTRSEIPVTWDSEPAYDGGRLGDYVFTADVGGYTLSGSAKLPQITVTVSADMEENSTQAPPTELLPCTKTEGCTLTDGHEGECVTKQPPSNGPLVKTITGWTFVDDDFLTGNELSIPNVSMGHQADFDTVVSMLPTQISAEIDKVNGGEADREGGLGRGGAEQTVLDITGWNCPEYKQGDDGNWPLAGDYTFTASLPKGYGCDPSPTVHVVLGGAMTYANSDYHFDKGSGKLTIFTNSGTTDWQKDNNIKKTDVLSIEIQDTVTEIGDYAFMNCTGLTSIDKLPSSLTSLGNSTFFSCTGLTSIDNLPSSLTSIGKFTFFGCTGLTSIDNLPSSLKSIGESTFSSCTGLTSIDNLPSSLTSIGDVTFGNCTGLTNIDNLPSSLTSIGKSTFSSCTGLTSIDLTGLSSLTSIGESTFFGCTGLTSMDKLPSSLTSIGESTFAGCTGLTSIDLTGLSSLTSIGESTFAGCTGLTSIDNLPSSLMSIGDYTFRGCTGLTSIDNLPSSLTSIGSYTFSSCTGLTSIDLTGLTSLTSIGDGMFAGCTNLTEVALPDSLESIGIVAFNDCDLKEITIPANVTSVGKWVFLANTNLKTVVFLRATAPSFGEDIFYGISTPPTVYVPEGATGYGSLNPQTITSIFITKQPVDVTIIAGDTATFTVTAIGEQPLAYQWQVHEGTGWKDVADGTGGDTATYTTPATVAVMNGWQYRCVSTNAAGTATSGAATLTVEKQTWAVNVKNGASDKTAAAEGETVTITAGNAPVGQTFDKWTTVDGVTFANENAASTTFMMPAKAVTVTATYKALPLSTYAITVKNGTSDKAAASEGEVITITAETAPAGQTFDKWTTADGVTFANENTASTTFRMPAKAVTVTATYKNNGGSPTSGDGSSSGGGESSYSEPEPQSSYTVAGDNISRSVSRYDLKKLADSGKSLTLACDKASMTFSPAALRAILAAVPSTANITFAAVPADLTAFPDAAKQIGAHPAYDFTISYKDSNGNLVTVPVNFPAGSAAITLNYTPAAGEVTGSMFMVYVDGKGAVTWLDKSSYDNGKMLVEVPHFSTYGVAYKAPAPVFADITDHWAKEDIEFVAARSLLSGTGNGLFSPDGTMTRGMFVTALGRLAGVNPGSYQTRSFTDVKADAYYAAYVEWAAQKNIVKGTGDKLFSPDMPVTREQMAVMMVNYAGQMGYSIPAPLTAITFADGSKISEWAAKEVAAMQRAGIIKGKDGNRFDPQENATRAEVSAVLRRFVEIVIDPATAAGWVKNDSGHWLYYKGGTALNGWQTIGKLRYFFNADGVMHEGWKQDTDTDKWYYWTNAGAATGWKEIDGKWYYFDENGVMAVNTKVDGYEIGPDGARKEN